MHSSCLLLELVEMNHLKRQIGMLDQHLGKQHLGIVSLLLLHLKQHLGVLLEGMVPKMEVIKLLKSFIEFKVDKMLLGLLLVLQLIVSFHHLLILHHHLQYYLNPTLVLLILVSQEFLDFH